MIPNQLHIFNAVVKNGNFSAAARQLGTSSAAVSKAIATLEKSMSLRLFHRTTRSLALTEDGDDLYRRTGHLVEQLEDQIRLSSDRQQTPSGRLKVNLPDSFGRMMVLPLLPEFLEQYPEIELDLNFDDRIGDLAKEGADVGIGVLNNPESSLIARDFYQLQPVLVASDAYLERYGTPRSPQELAQHNCIAYRSPTTGRKFDWSFHQQDQLIQIEPQGNLVVNSISAAMKAVDLGIGIARIGIGHARNCLQQGCFKRVLEEFEADPLKVRVYYASRSYLPAKTRVFIDYLMQHTQDERSVELEEMIHTL
ncbi:LysR family transcriptional regulator [Motiliproteus coralliicola]|uniref:LysR family transcriptional regulator n=1 Tax=Motiliproteus coralliicola TaxID=2283196 RepID=A0A369WGL4_9GAMM|nr:LysR family transcriptional regulator [Motiliproteus coralliicola]RDE19834.1 LysR family transcriptional regulator [Motiliproteus coralliicola]